MEKENIDLKIKTIHGIKWTGISNIIKAIIQIIQLIILAHYLNIEDFGLVAIVMVVIGFSQLFMDMGISNAIIQKQDVNNVQLSSLYWLNIFSGIILTVIVFQLSPFISRFYNQIELQSLIEILSFSFIINALGNQYGVLLRKNLQFNILAKIEIIAIIISFISSIILAIKGYGAFSLVYATLINTIVINTVLILNGIKSYVPKFIFNYLEIKSFLKFGLYQIGQNSIVYFNNQLDIILIGKLLGPEILGIYSLTKQLVMKPSQIINPIITNVTFPVMSKIQDDLLKLKNTYLRMINYLSSINFLIYINMAILASSIIPLILGAKWYNTIEIFQILSIYALIRSTTSPAGSLILARGRADIGFWWSISEFFILPIIIYMGSKWGLYGISLSLLIFQSIMLFPNWYFIVKKACNANFKEYFVTQLKPLISILISTFITIIFTINLNLGNLLTIIVFSTINIIIYILVSYRINNNFLLEIENIIFKRTIK